MISISILILIQVEANLVIVNNAKRAKSNEAAIQLSRHTAHA